MNNGETGTPKDVLVTRLEDPETRARISRILDRLDLVEEILSPQSAIFQLQTDSMIERLSISMEKATDLIDRVSSPGMLGLLKAINDASSTLTVLMESSKEMEKSGSLKSLMDGSMALKAFSDILTESMVERIAVQVEKLNAYTESLDRLPINEMIILVNSLKDAGLFETLPEIMGAIVAIKRLMTDSLLERVMVVIDQGIAYQNNLTTALRMIPAPPQNPPGVFGLFRLLREPDVQKAIYLALTTLKSLSIKENH